MTAYLINRFDIIDDKQFDRYVAAVPPIIARHGGEVLVGHKSARAPLPLPGQSWIQTNTVTFRRTMPA